MKKEYLIIGSNNFWYASCLTSLKEVEEEIKNIKENVQKYGNPEGLVNETMEMPDTLYVYKAEEIKQIDLGEIIEKL